MTFPGKMQSMGGKECNPFKVMLVEDDGGFRRSLADLLTSRFPDILLDEAANGAEAMEKVERFLPCLIFMDIKLPDRNGLEITKQIKALHPGMRVIILTSYDFPEYREAAQASGAYWFLSKGSSTAEEIQNLVEGLSAECAA
jgi:DNA-binding NarL/FixJ family response regulator